MKEKIEELQALLLGKRIKDQTSVGPKYYTVKSIVERRSLIVIETNELKTFTYDLSSIDFFLESIEIVDNTDLKEKNNNIFKGSMVVNKKEPKSNELTSGKALMMAPEATKNVSDGLMSIFNDLTGNNAISEEKLKQAKLACDVAGKIIDIEKIRLGYLALNYK